MLLSRIRDLEGTARLVARDGTEAYVIRGADSIHALALDCARGGETLAERIAGLGLGEAVDLEHASQEGRVLAPVCPGDPRQVRVTIAEIDGGRPLQLAGATLVSPGAAVASPPIATARRPVPHIAGFALVDDAGTSWTIGLALGFLLEPGTGAGRQTHAAVAVAPEILVGPPPGDFDVRRRIVRDGEGIVDERLSCDDRLVQHMLSAFEGEQMVDPPEPAGAVEVRLYPLAVHLADGTDDDRAGDIHELSARSFGVPLKVVLATGPGPGNDDRLAVNGVTRKGEPWI